MEKEKINLKEKITSFLVRFKDFAFKESTFGVAIGIMIGGAIKSVIDSIVKDILTPPIAKLTSGIDFADLYITLGSEQYGSLQEAKDAGAVVISYGNFINTFISFLITALVLFILVIQAEKLTTKKEKKEEKKIKQRTKICPYCKSEIHKDAKKCPFCTSTVK